MKKSKEPSRKVVLRVYHDLCRSAELRRALGISYRGADRRGMVSMYFQDSRDLQEVGDLIFLGEFILAYQKARSLDTANRERVPESFYRLFREIDKS